MDATLFKRITTLIDWLNAEVYEFLYPWIQYLMDVGGFPLVLGVVLIGGLVISIGSQALGMMILSRPALPPLRPTKCMGGYQSICYLLWGAGRGLGRGPGRGLGRGRGC